MYIQKNKPDPEIVKIATELTKEVVSPAVATCYKNMVATSEKNPNISHLWAALGVYLTYKKFSK